MATNLSKTGHTERFSAQFAKFGLTANIRTSFVDVGLAAEHPVLRIQDTLQTFHANNKLDLFMMGNNESTFYDFWLRWQYLQPKHPIFSEHSHCLGSCIPVAVHADEGTTLKKKGIMIIQVQPIIGKGTRKRQGTPEVPGCNMLGESLQSRFLYSVMLTRVYSGKKKKNKPLLKLMDHLSKDLADAFYSGIEFGDGQTFFLVPIALKGDWPALIKLGGLQRHFGRVIAIDDKAGKGICHLCQADQEGHKNWHDVSWENMSRMHAGAPLPWDTDPSLVSAIPLPNEYKVDFFRIDMFHTLHKGVFGDIAANTLVLGIHDGNALFLYLEAFSF